MMKLSKKNISKEGFQSFLDIHLDNLHSYYCTDFTIRKPDYFVRQEFMFEDYCKIPFINESDLYSSGKLREICNIKMNQTAEVSMNTSMSVDNNFIRILSSLDSWIKIRRLG